MKGWLNEQVNKIIPQRQCLYYRMIIKMANHNSKVQSYLFSPISNTSSVNVHGVCSTHCTKIPDWGLVGLKSHLSSRPWYEAASTRNKRPFYNLHKVSIYTGWSLGDFGIKLSYAQCGVIFIAHLPPFIVLTFTHTPIYSVNRECHHFHDNGYWLNR